MDHKTIKWIAKHIKCRAWSILALILSHVGNALFGVLFALGSKGVIDSATSGDARMFRDACFWQIMIICGNLICLTAARHLKERLSADLERDWKRKLLHGLLHGEYQKVSSYHSAELLNRMINDVAKLNEGILSIVPAFAAMITRVAAAVLVLGSLDGRFTLIVAAIGILVVFATGVLRKWLKQLNKQVSMHDGRVSGFLQETMEKLLMIQSLDVAREVEHRADGFLNDRYDIQRKRKNVGVTANALVNMMYYGAGFLALFWCARKMMIGTMSFGSLTAVIQLVNQLQRPFVEMSGVLSQYSMTLAAAERLMELELIQGEPAPVSENASDIYQDMDSIHAEELSFSYDRDQILQEASFSLPKGAFAVITGHSGIGKSTILKLMLGIFAPDSGRLYLQCADKNILLDRSTRRLFAYAPQGNLLLSGTIRENLTIVKPHATRAEIQEAVFVSAMDEFLPQLPMGLDTRLGESGTGLSEGQAQRLSIARAVLSGAPILLLDECTSALDPETEEKVLKRLRELPDRTCIAVTHRSAAVEVCDWRLEVSGGKIETVPNVHADS